MLLPCGLVGVGTNIVPYNGNSVSFVIPGDAVPFSRAGSNGNRRYTPTKQANFMAAVKLYASRAMEGHSPMEGPLQLTIRAAYVHPRSWSKVQKQQTRKTSKPDLSNIIKIIEDSINTIVWIDDSQVCFVVAEKIYDKCADVRVFVSTISG